MKKRCSKCKTSKLDHVVPLAKGGEHSYANVKTACADCNLRKGATLLEAA